MERGRLKGDHMSGRHRFIAEPFSTKTRTLKSWYWTVIFNCLECPRSFLPHSLFSLPKETTWFSFQWIMGGVWGNGISTWPMVGQFTGLFSHLPDASGLHSLSHSVSMQFWPALLASRILSKAVTFSILLLPRGNRIDWWANWLSIKKEKEKRRKDALVLWRTFIWLSFTHWQKTQSRKKKGER